MVWLKQNDKIAVEEVFCDKLEFMQQLELIRR